jgi:hypothetical protein
MTTCVPLRAAAALCRCASLRPSLRTLPLTRLARRGAQDDLAFLEKKKEEAKARTRALARARRSERSECAAHFCCADARVGAPPARLDGCGRAIACQPCGAAVSSLRPPRAPAQLRAAQGGSEPYAPHSAVTRAGADAARCSRRPQALQALKAKAGEKGAFGGKGLSYSGKK